MKRLTADWNRSMFVAIECTHPSSSRLLLSINVKIKIHITVVLHHIARNLRLKVCKKRVLRIIQLMEPRRRK
jgi:hypothetical protein